MLIVELQDRIDKIKSIGIKTANLLSKLSIFTVKDLLFYFPRDYSDRTNVKNFSQISFGEQGTFKVKVIDKRLIGSLYKKFLKVIIQDEKGNYGALLCFNRNYMKNIFLEGKYYFVTGKVYKKFNEYQLSNFEFEEADENYEGKIEPIYSLTEGITQKKLRLIIHNTIGKYLNEIENDISDNLIKKYDLLNDRDAIKNIHFPENNELYQKARKTLIFKEFFFQKLYLLQKKEEFRQYKKERKKIKFEFKKSVLEKFGFELMDYQKEAIEKIEKRIFSDEIFSILLQGDVGSGKTLVSFVTMLDVVESGYQAVLMAPTEVLALQHFNNLKKLIGDLWLDAALLTGNTSKKDRDEILQGIKDGTIKIIIGTHALYSDDVIYNNLGYVVIDEQHRFGVEQRYKLLSKGKNVDLLLMSATPIPQALAHSIYGDMELITMKGTINGRKKVKTWVVNNEKERIDNMHKWIMETIEKENGRVLFVYPLINESDSLNYKNLIDEYENLKKIYQKFGCEYIHSKIDSETKNEIIKKFRNGDIKVLASTTVIEVGLDVPDANIIVVENAENYGLSTLHQLRGRVGRNNKQGYMILIAEEANLTEQAKKRLELIKTETDGFRIAEEDLKLRGPGDFIGTRQSGLFNIKLADFSLDMDILKSACDAAVEIYNNDRYLEKIENINTKKSFFIRLNNFVEY